jgi:serine/threonine-protein kinase
MAALPGIIGDKYRVTAQIGKGGMATVYSAVHVGTGSRVALKVMPLSEIDVEPDSPLTGGSMLARFEREARLAGSMQTQYVTRVFDTGMDPTHGPYIVMELLQGEDIKDLVQRLGPLRPDLALRIAAQAAVGLARAHAVGVTHRDVKASNLFLTTTEFDTRVVKLLDFGIAKGRVESIDAGDSKTLTQTGAMLGSPHYMSPEQVLGTKTLDHRTDIWSLGIVLYKCLSARTPFDDRDTVGQLVVSIVQSTPPSVQDFAPWVPPEVASIVSRALRKDPADRFQSAQEMSEALCALLLDGDIDIDPAMLTPMTDDERRDVKPRLSVRVRAAQPVTIRPGRRGDVAAPTEERDETISSATASMRLPQMKGPASLRSKLGTATAVVAVCGLAVWGLARHPSQAPATASALASPPPLTATTVVPATPPPPTNSPWHVQVHVQPVTASVTVDDVQASVSQGAVDVAGELGSVHRVRLRSAGRETTVEVIIAEDGARPNIAALADSGSSSASARRAAAASHPASAAAPGPAAAPAPTKPAARFATQFE